MATTDEAEAIIPITEMGTIVEAKRAEEKSAFGDRSKWSKGPWDDEPDRVEWRSAVGYPCLALRGPMGSWCGYAAVPKGHPAHGKHYDSVPVEVHGGLTYGAECRGEICHVPEPGEPGDGFWLGFDCAHAFDLSPGMEAFRNEHMPEAVRRRAEMPDEFQDVYRDLAYVKAECESLAAQLFAMRDGPPIEDEPDE